MNLTHDNVLYHAHSWNHADFALAQKESAHTSAKQAYEVEGIRSDETTFTVEVLECRSEDEAKGLAQHYADLWRRTVSVKDQPLPNHR